MKPTQFLTLRPAARDDAERAAEILILSRRICVPFAPLVHTDAEIIAWVRDVLLVKSSVTVALLDASQVGMIAVSRAETVSWIEQLYVDPAHVGAGIGSRLLASALDRLPLPVRAYTFQQNARARHFYERHAFTAIEFTDGSGNEERCPDVLYELREPRRTAARDANS